MEGNKQRGIELHQYIKGQREQFQVERASSLCLWNWFFKAFFFADSFFRITWNNFCCIDPFSVVGVHKNFVFLFPFYVLTSLVAINSDILGNSVFLVIFYKSSLLCPYCDKKVGMTGFTKTSSAHISLFDGYLIMRD